MPNHTKLSSDSVSAMLRGTFLDHPASIGESYFEHLRAALGYSASLTVTAAAAFIHALVPCLCETTARTRIETLHNKLQGRVPVSSGTTE